MRRTDCLRESHGWLDCLIRQLTHDTFLSQKELFSLAADARQLMQDAFLSRKELFSLAPDARQLMQDAFLSRTDYAKPAESNSCKEPAAN